MKLEDLKIYIVESNLAGYLYFQDIFKDIKNVEVVNDYIQDFYEEHKNEIDCLVSPANAFGIMTGGYDAALSDILGWDFQLKVQKYIKDNFYGEQLVGTSFIIDTDIPGLKLIHTPTMQYPSVIIDDMVIYHCMRATLMCALENNVKCIVIPVFGGRCGGVKSEVAAKRMKDAYLQIRDKKEAEFDF